MNERIITVTGMGNVSVKPNLIIITMEIEKTDFSYSGVLQLTTTAIDVIRTALINIDYQKDSLKTTDFNIDTDYERYKDSKGNWKRKFNGYKCTHKLKLEFDFNMEQLNRTLLAIASSDINPEFQINFSVKDKTAVSEQLLKSAVKNAFDKAAILANAAGFSLGAVQRIDYSWGEIHLYSDTKMAMPLSCTSETSHGIDIEPDDIKVNDTVTVAWAIT